MEGEYLIKGRYTQASSEVEEQTLTLTAAQPAGSAEATLTGHGVAGGEEPFVLKALKPIYEDGRLAGLTGMQSFTAFAAPNELEWSCAVGDEHESLQDGEWATQSAAGERVVIGKFKAQRHRKAADSADASSASPSEANSPSLRIQFQAAEDTLRSTDLQPQCVELHEFVQRMAEEKLPSDTMVRCDGMPGWVPLKTVLQMDDVDEDEWSRHLALPPQELEKYVAMGFGNLSPRLADVRLHIYDATNARVVSGLNSLLPDDKAGAYHVGVEILGKEWSFGGSTGEEGRGGVGWCTPKGDPDHRFRRTVDLGRTSWSRHQIDQAIAEMQREPAWAPKEYSLLRHNCVHFAQALVTRLGVTSRAFPRLGFY